jgi:signal transduction histidine kinase
MTTLQYPKTAASSMDDKSHHQRDRFDSGNAVARTPMTLSLLDMILSSMAQGVAVFDTDLKLVVFNRRYVEIFNYPPEIARIGARFEDIVRYNVTHSGLAVDDIEAHIRSRVEQARDYHIERRSEHHRPNGTVIAICRSPIHGGGFINTYTDITEQKRSEEEAVRYAKLLRTTLENMADGVRVFDKDLKLVAWNVKALEMLNYPPEMGKVGTPFWDFAEYSTKRGDYSEEDKVEGTKARLQRAQKSQGRNSEFVSPQGRIIQKKRNPMPDGGFVSTYQDVTELKHAHMMLTEARDRAERASRAKSEFLANMSHELRTPLNIIIGFSQIMCDELLGPLGAQAYREYAVHIKESGVHLMSIINDILDLSKVEAGKTQLSEDEIDIRTVVRSCLRLMEERAAAAKLNLVTTMPDEMPAVRADERLMKQIVLNLLSNAVKFTPEGGTVSIGIELSDGLLITVADTGIGMNPEDIPTALTPFVQVDTSMNRKVSGTGLGLPLVDSFARLHGGSLTLHSKPGEGTTAVISLPKSRLIVPAP